MLIKQSETNAARRSVVIGPLANTSDDSAYTSALSAADLQISKAGGAFGNSAGTATHIGVGYYKYEFTAGECDTLGSLMVRCAASGTYPDAWQVQVVAFDPYATASLGLTNLDVTVSSRSSHSADDVWDDANGIEPGLTPRQALRGMAAMLFGKVSGAGSGREVFRSAVDDRDALTITNDTAGNRTSVTRNL